MRNTYIPLTCVLLWAGLSLPAQNPYIHHYTTQEGLPSNMVYYIYQDSRKFIWFATDAGVSRYDGTTFTNYRKKDGLASNEVIRIREDSFGRIWFFHFNGALSFNFRNKFYSESNTRFLKSLEGKEFYFDFFEDTDSTLYFYNSFCEIIALGKRGAVRRYDLQENLFRQLSGCFGFPQRVELRKITKSKSGELLFWTYCGLLKQKTFSDPPVLVSQKSRINKVFQGEKNSLIIDVYTGKLYRFIDEQLIDSVALPLYTKSFLKSVLEDKGDLLWVADYFHGVYCLRRDTIIQRFNIPKPQSVLRDHENNIWVGSTNDGAFKISPYLLSHLHYPDTLFLHRGITGMSPDGSGGVWLTSGMKVDLLKNKILYSLDFGNSRNYINLIAPMKNGSLVIGERGAFFYTLEDVRLDRSAKKVRYGRAERIISGLKTIAVNPDGRQISAFEVSMLYLSDQDHLFRKKTDINLGQRIYSIFYDANDSLVLNGRKMFVCRENRLVPNRKLSLFDNRIITNHLNIDKTTELFNIEGDSIYLFHGNRFYNLSDEIGAQIDLPVRNITYDKPVLYLATSRNVYTCDHPLNAISQGKTELRLLDINFRNIHDILVNNDSLYIASDDGLTIIPEASIGKVTTLIPIPYIRDVFINDQEKDPEDQGFSVRGNAKIAFSFGCINYSSSPLVYAYKLEGLDTEWTTGTAGNVVYQRLPGGNYTFKLKVRKSTSEWSSVLERPIQVKAPFWHHPLFFTSLAIIALAGMTLVIIRRKNLQMRHRELDHHLVTLELKALQSMMNPHFIFNALGSIQNFLLQNKTGEAGLYLSQFARLIRQNMNAVNEAMINLDEEFDRLSNYLDLERLRMENKFDYKIDIDEGIDPEDILIPSMIIQPFVENSIWHGISALEGKGFVSIHFSHSDEKTMKVIIEDNGIGIDKAQSYQPKDEKHLRLGMEMIRKRLELLGRKHAVNTRVELSEAFPGTENPGTRVTMVIPFSGVGTAV